MDPERQSVRSVISFFLARSSSSLADLSQSFLRETPSVSSSVESSLLICDAKYAAAPATAVTTPTTFPAFASHSFAFCSRLCLHSGHSVASWSAITFPQSEQIPLTFCKYDDQHHGRSFLGYSNKHHNYHRTKKHNHLQIRLPKADTRIPCRSMIPPLYVSLRLL